MISHTLQNESIAIPTVIAVNFLFYEISTASTIHVINALTKLRLIETKDKSLQSLSILIADIGLNIFSITLLNLSLYQ